jgi:hypothetical protein
VHDLATHGPEIVLEDFADVDRAERLLLGDLGS